jgi:NodT family efflux transporter outer membrane factor (OMF) lipoprotein
MMRLSSSTMAPLISFMLGGCAVGPDYVRPKIAVPPAYKEAPGDKGSWKVATPQDTGNQEAWWLIFHDPALNALQVEATTANQNIAVAQAQYEQALALVREARAGFFPALTATVGDTKSRSSVSVTGGIGSTPGAAGGRSAGHSASAALQATWEPDLWGGVRRLIEADEAAAEASAAQLAAIRLSTQATLAQTYFQLRALDETQKILDESVTAYEKFLKMTKNHYGAGTASRLAVLQAETQLQAIRVLAVDNGVARAQFEHAIAVLTGCPPANFSISRKASSLTPPLIPLDVPSVLLERRPDIAQAERLMAQANAQVGVASAAFFPVLTLSGTRGVGSRSFGHLFSNPAPFWSLGAQVAGTLLEGGSRAAAVEAAGAEYQASVAHYRQTVLAAFQDVEDNLATLNILKVEGKAQEGAVVAAEKELELTMNAHKAGTLAASDVLTALFNVYAARRDAIHIASRRMVAAVGLIKALGGGWKNQLVVPGDRPVR